MASTYQKVRHDIGITNCGSAGAGTDLVGMMLAQTPDGVPAYAEYDGKYLADQFFTGSPSQVNMNPEEELILSQDDWRSGFGLEYYDPQDTKRYFSSIGMDLRHRGMVIAGPTPTAVTPIARTKETWISPVFHKNVGSWTNPINAYDGNDATYANKTISADSWSGWIEFYVPTVSCSSVRFKWLDEYNFPNNIDVDVYYNGAWQDVYLGNDGRGALVDKGLGGTYDVTAVRINIYNDDSAARWAYFYELYLYAEDDDSGYPVAFAEFNDYLYIGVGNALVKFDKTAGTFSTVGAFTVNITDLAVMPVSGTDYLWIALGTSFAYYYMVAADTFTESNATDKTYQFFCTVHTDAPTLYGNDADNTIRSTVNPLNAGTAWSDPATTVGSSYHAITDLVSRAGALYIMKEDKPYYLDSSGNPQADLARELEVLTSSTSGKNSLMWKNKLYIPCGQQGLLETDGTTNTFRNPSAYCTNLSDFVGRVQALGADEEYLHIIVDNGAKVEVLACRMETIGATTSWVVHPIAEITLTNCGVAFVSSVKQKRLWVASTVDTESLYYIPLPVGYGNILSDTNRKFKTGATFETPWLHGGFKADDKAWVKITLTMGHAYLAGSYFQVKYKELGDAAWSASIGNFTGVSGNMVQSRFIDTTNKPFSSMMKFQFTAVTTDPLFTPVLLNYDVRAVMYPPIRRQIHCVVRCANEIVCKNGMIDKNMYATIKSTLDNVRNNPVWFVSIRDIDGNTLDVKFLPVPQSMQRLLITKKEKGREQERHYHILMQTVDLS